MTIEEASRAFEIPMDMLEKCISCRLLPEKESGDYEEGSFQEPFDCLFLR